MKDILDKLTLEIKYEFSNINYLETALIHSSYCNENKSITQNNERLEFLGDSILGFVIAEYFFYNCKELREGSLSKMRSQVVNENSLYDIAMSISLGDYIKLGKGELKNKGNLRASILSDCLEAIIGAIYLDGGIEESKKFIIRLFEEKLIDAINKKNVFDYKTIIQEYVQKNKLGSLEYLLYEEKGPDNNKEFFYKLIINKKEISTGYGISKKKAQQCAAKNALRKLGELSEED